jgi:hypothetical protein
MRNVSDKSCRENFYVVNFLSLKSCRLWDNVEKHDTARQATDNIIWRMRTACWIPKVTNTRSTYVILIAFPLQQWLRERASMLRLYVQYIAYLVNLMVSFGLHNARSYRHRPDRPWDPPILLYNGYRVFLGVKAAGACRPSTPSSAEVKERVQLYLSSPSGPSCPVLGWTLPFTFNNFTSWFAHLGCYSRSIQQTLFMSARAFCAQFECQRKERVTDLTVRAFQSTRMTSPCLEF